MPQVKKLVKIIWNKKYERKNVYETFLVRFKLIISLFALLLFWLSNFDYQFGDTLNKTTQIMNSQSGEDLINLSKIIVLRV